MRPCGATRCAAAFVLAWLLSAAPCAAESVSPGRYDGLPIASIELLGPGAPTLEAFTGLTSLRLGTRYSASAVRRAVERLFEVGEYTDVRVAAEDRPDAVALTVTFVSKIRINEIEIRGHHQPSAQVRDIVGIREGDEWTPTTAPEAVERLRAWYADRGYVATIRPEITLEDQGTRARVILHVDERDRLRITAIRFPGSPAFSRLRHLIALRTAAGEYPSRERLDRGLDRLADLYHGHGYLKAIIGPPRVTRNRDGIGITIPVERGPRYRGVVRGRTGVRTARLLDRLTVFTERRDDEDFLAEETERLTAYLIDRGFRHAQVRIERIAGDDQVLLRVTVNAGPRFPLTAVTVAGSSTLSSDAWGRLIETKTSGRFRARYAKTGTLKADRERILNWYRTHGFASARAAVEVVETPAPPSAEVVFAVDEGPQTLIGDIRMEGADDTRVPLHTVIAQFELTEGAPYVEARVRAARAAMLALYSEHGYIDAGIDAVPRLSPDQKRVELAFVIREGTAVTIGPITVSGNERTRDHVLLRELDVRQGDVFNPRRILESQRRVARLGFLREVRLEPNDPERIEPVKNLHLTVKERDAGTMDIGAGYANFEGVRGFSELTYRNLMGTGRRIGLLVEGSRLERKTVLSYREPWVFGRRIDGRAAVTGGTKNEKNRGYSRTTYGAILGLDKELSSTLKTSLVYDYQSNSFEQAGSPPVVLPPNDRIGSITPSIVRDTRDDPFDPSSGSVNALAIEQAALLLVSQEQFWKITAGSSWFHSLHRMLGGAISLRTGVSNRFGETRAARVGERLLLPTTKRFFLGGRSSVRGYEEDTLGPIGIDGKPIGGNVMLVGNAELRIRLPKALGLVLFVDSGNVWANHQALRWTDLRTTAGAGLRYNTPVGPLRLDYGHKLNWRPGERHGTFHFTLGHAF